MIPAILLASLLAAITVYRLAARPAWIPRLLALLYVLALASLGLTLRALLAR